MPSFPQRYHLVNLSYNATTKTLTLVYVDIMFPSHRTPPTTLYSYTFPPLPDPTSLTPGATGILCVISLRELVAALHSLEGIMQIHHYLLSAVFCVSPSSRLNLTLTMFIL